jgi:hypothetical protein
MARSIADDELTPYAKYETFKKAYDNVNFFTESGNLIAAFVLCFSILEDRLCAAVVICCRATKRKINEDKLSKMPFKQRVERLLEIQAIDDDLHARLLNAADLRNELTHEMMWRLDVFHTSHIKAFRSLINELQKVQRKHEKLIRATN